MMKATPDEIKKALKYHKGADFCLDCPYYCFSFDCSPRLAADALAYIEQLETEREGKSDERNA